MDALVSEVLERRFVVTGRVQGVGFRWFVRQAAEALGVRGWVRNLPDGSVAVEVAGHADAVARLQAALRSGPAAARVDEVRAEPRTSAEPLPRAFRVER